MKFDVYAIKNVITVIVVVAAAVNVNGLGDILAVESQISYISSYHGGMTFLKSIGCCIIIWAGKAVTIVNIAVDVVMYVSDFCCCDSTY